MTCADCTKGESMADQVTVRQAAKELHMDVLTLRYLMQTKELNIGFFIRRPGCRRGAYKIYRHLLDAEKRRLGIEQD